MAIILGIIGVLVAGTDGVYLAREVRGIWGYLFEYLKLTGL